MALINRFSVSLALFLAALCVPQVARSSGQSVYKIQFAVSPVNDEPIVGSATCDVDQICHLLDPELSEIGLSVTVSPNGLGRLHLRCRERCSFHHGYPTLDFGYIRTSGAGSKHHFDVFDGAEDSFEIQLVLRDRAKIGHIALIFRHEAI